MKQKIRILFPLFAAVIACLAPTIAWNQCPNKVMHLSGTQQIDCHDVTVTAQGATGAITSCSYGPYRVGITSNPGSYTFVFSPPVGGVSVNISALNNFNGSEEELRFEVNGVFYPITIPGTPDGCSSPAIITPAGTIGAVSGQTASWKDITISTSITTLKVEDVFITGQPHGTVFSLYFCSSCCPTDAGNLVTSPLNLCPGDLATVSDATQTFLESDDILRYILFSDLNDTLGSILATSITPSFDFNPATMQPDITYYIAAIAGNNLNGDVDFNDPCLDISNPVPVTWHPKPAVTFAVADPNVCAGVCTTVTAAFTGIAPFTLTYTSPSGSATQTFPDNSGTLQVCPPAGFAGPLTLQATSLTDAYCTCMN